MRNAKCDIILALGAAHAQRTPEKHPQGNQLVTLTQRSKGRCALVASCGGYMDIVLLRSAQLKS